jgi:hypothetical protein
MKVIIVAVLVFSAVCGEAMEVLPSKELVDGLMDGTSWAREFVTLGAMEAVFWFATRVGFSNETMDKFLYGDNINRNTTCNLHVGRIGTNGDAFSGQSLGDTRLYFI